MGGYELLYFAGKGRGEAIRLTLSAAGIKFLDKRITYAEWPALKPTIEAGFLPQLTLPNGETMCESMAIVRYIAKANGLMGDNDWEYYQMEKTIGTYDDLSAEMVKLYFYKGDDKEAQVKAFQDGKGNQMLNTLQKYLDASKTGYIAGSAKPTVADILVVNALDLLKTENQPLLDKFPNLMVYSDKVVAALPSMAEYIKNRPTQ